MSQAEMAPVSSTFICRFCGGTFPYNPIIGPFAIRAHPTVCDPCMTKIEEANETERKIIAASRAEALARKWEARWLDICPPLYRDTDMAKLPAEAAAKLPAVMAWKFGPRGLLLHGVTKRGKTRTAYLLLRRLHFADRILISAWDTGDWVNECSKRFRSGDGEEWTERQIRVPLLFLDDIGNEASGERGEGELFRVIKRRGEEMKPIIMTTNKTGINLREKFREEDRGAALVRRLAEFCECIGF